MAGCDDAPAPVATDAAWTPAEVSRLAGMRLDPTPRPDPTNRFADDPGAAAFGQALFFDPGLSPHGISCATCHRPDKGFADGLPLSRGVGTAARHTPSIVGSQYAPFLFWDGRADSLWMQALGPLENPDEMGSDRVFVVRQVTDRHRAAYEAIFGPLPALELPEHGRPDATDPVVVDAWQDLPDDARDGVNRVFANVGKAIAAYERRLVARDAPFDRYVDALVAGDPTGGGALDDAEIRGLRLFMRDGNCVSCHSGPQLTDRAFHNLGLAEVGNGYDQGRTVGAMKLLASEFNCRGRYSDTQACEELQYLNPSFADFESAFKTPSLRNVAETAPYMHNGSMPDLQAVMRFYDELPGKPLKGHRELTLKPLNFTAEQDADVVAFLEALTGDPLPAELLKAP